MVFPFRRLPNRFVYAVILAVVIFLTLAAEATLIPASPTRTVVSDFTYPLLSSLAAFSLFTAARGSFTRSKRLGWAWLILALAQLSYTLGGIAWTVSAAGSQSLPVPLLAGGALLAYYPLFIVGVFLIPGQERSSAEWLEVGIDMTIVILVALLGFWNFLVGPAVVVHGGLTWLSQALDLAMPVGDIALFAALLMLLYKRPKGQAREPLWLMFGAVLAMIATDAASRYQILQHAFDGGSLADLGYGLSFIVMTLAGMLQALNAAAGRQPGAQPSQDGETPAMLAGNWVTFFPYLWVPPAMILLFLSIANRLRLPASQVAVVVGLVICLVVLRQVLVLEKNRQLNGRLARTMALAQQHAASLSEKSQMLNAIIAASPLTIDVTDPHGRVQLWSPSAERLFGWKAEEVLGKELPNIPPNLKTEANEMFQSELQGEVVDGKETRRLTRSGAVLEVNLSTAPLHSSAGEVTGVVAMLADITERKRDEEKMRQQAARSGAQAEIAQLIVESGTNFQAILDIVTRRLSSLMGELCLIYLLPEGSDQLQLASQYPERPAAAAEISQKLATLYWQKLLMEKSLPGSALSSHDGPVFTQTSLHHLVINTLHTPERVLGALCLGRDLAKSPFTHDDAAFLQDIANWTAVAVTNAQLFSKVQAQSEEVSGLLTLSSQLNETLATDQVIPIILSGLHTMLAFDAGMIILASSGHHKSRVFLADGFLAANTGLELSMNENISLSVMQKQKAFVTTNYSSEPGRTPYLDHVDQMGPALIVPLKTEVGVIGEITVCRERNRGARAFTNDEIRLLSAVGAGAGNAIRRDQLLEEARDRLSKVQALHQIDLVITSSLDMRVSLGAILDQVLLHLKVDAADVLVLNQGSHMLTYATGVGFRSRAIEHTQLHLGQGFAGIAALERRTLTVSNLVGRKTDYLRAPLLLLENFIYYSAVPLITKDQVKGVLEIFHRGSLKPDADWMEFLESLAGQAAIAIDNASQYFELKRANLDLVQAYDATIESWARALDVREKEAEGHSLRVTQMTLILARGLGINEADLINVRRGALLHDIGKVGVPDDILFKPTALSAEEWEQVARHPQNAYEMLAAIDYLKQALDIPYGHHEKWDGSGYPRGLKGVQIPLAARVFAVIDVWDALTSNRAYRSAWDEDKALEYIQAQAGKHFDPYVVEAFMKIRPWTAAGEK